MDCEFVSRLEDIIIIITVHVLFAPQSFGGGPGKKQKFDYLIFVHVGRTPYHVIIINRHFPRKVKCICRKTTKLLSHIYFTPPTYIRRHLSYNAVPYTWVYSTQSVDKDIRLSITGAILCIHILDSICTSCRFAICELNGPQAKFHSECA